MSLQRLFNTARLLGDRSSLQTGVGARLSRRLQGRLMSGAMIGFNVYGLIMWGQFLSWMRDSVQQAVGKEHWVGSFLPYSRRIERRSPYFQPSVQQTLLERTFPGTQFQPITANRSGVYAGGRFLADIRSIAKGNIVMRGVRRGTGAESSRLFWGSLQNPDFNIFKAMAERTQELARQRLKALNLVDSGALVDSVQTGETHARVAALSIMAGMEAKRQAGDVAGAMRMIRTVGPTRMAIAHVRAMRGV